MITTLLYSNEIRASPDTAAHVRVDIVNTGSTVVQPRLDVIGLPEGWVAPIEPIPELPPNQSWRGSISFTVPFAASHGRHLAMVRLVDTSTGESYRPNRLTLTILPLEGVDVTLAPGVVRGRIWAKTNIVVTNRSSEHVSLHLDGAAETLRLRCRPTHVDVAPGDIETAKLRVRAKPRLLDANRYSLSVTARGSQLPIRATGSFDHRPVIGSAARATAAVVFLLALAVGGFLAALRLLASDDEAPASVDSVDITASDATDSADGSGTTTSDDSEDDTTTANSAATDDSDASGMRFDQEGTVALGGSDDDLSAGVTVSLRRISLDNPATSTPTRAGPARGARKVFARGLQQAIALDTTDAPIELTTAENGRWTHTGLVAGLHYEISFRRSGYTTQSFVISPQRGVPLEPMEVELVPGDGALGGTVSGPDGPLGGAVVTVSDGQLTYTATTSTANGSLGNWSIEGIGTPSRYVVRISSNGFGTEVISTDLDPGEARTTLSTELTVGVGSITGVVQASGVGLGGAVITVSAGDTVVTTTTLTQGVPGAFSLPRLPVGIEYTLEVQADGWLTQTQTVFVGSAVDGVEINLLEDSGGAQGTVTNDQGATLGDVRVTIRSDTLSFETTTESTEGRWQVSGVPPGEYQVIFQRFNHLTAFGNITISAGASTRVPDPVLVFSTDTVLAANATLNGVLLDNRGQQVVGATIAIPGHDPALSTTSDADGRYEINGINFGSYRIRITSPVDSDTQISSHQPFEDYQTFTLNSTVSFSPTLFTNGAFNGTVTQTAAPGFAVPLAKVTVSGAALLSPRVLTVSSSGEFNEADFFPPGDYTLVAEAPGFFPIPTSRTIPVGSPTPITVGFEMSLRPRLQVTVVAPTGIASDSTVFSPVLDATVTLNPPATGTSGDLEKPVNSSTGIAEFAEEQNVEPDAEATQLEPGTYTIDVVASGYDPFPPHLETGVAIGETREVTIALTGTAGGIRDAANGTITYLYDNLPRPIAGASVSADVIPGFAPATGTSDVTPLLPVPRTTTTDQNGFWEVDDHRFGSSTYTVSASNFTTGTVDVDVSPGAETSGDLTLIAAASALSGRLELTTTDTTTSYEDFKATATGPGDNVTVTLAADGTYTIPITEQGTWSVTISRADDDNTNFNGLPGEQTGLSTDPGVTTSVANISATELGSISIEVTPSDATVKLCTAVDGCGTPLTPTDGTVQFTALPAGTYSVQVSGDEYETETSSATEIGAGQDVALPRIDLQEWGTLEGTLKGRRGSPGANPTDSALAGIQVIATPVGGGETYEDLTEADGSFSVPAPANTYNVTFDLNGYEASPLQPASLEFATTPATATAVGDVIYQASAVTLDISVENDAGTLIDAAITLSHGDETDLTGINHLAGSSPVTAGPLQPRTWTVTVTADGHNDLQTSVTIPPGGLGQPLLITLPRNTGSITGLIQAQILGDVDIGPVGGVTVIHTPPDGTGSTVTSDGSEGRYTVANVVNGASTLQFSKSNFATQSISVVVSDQSDATEQNIVLVPANSTITLTVADNPTANFEDLQAQLYLDTDAGGTMEVGIVETVGADRTVIFTAPPSRPTSDVARTHHYRIVLSGTDFVTKTVDDLDLLPGTPLTPGATIVSHPSAPQTLSVVARAAGGVTATWTAPASDGGDAVDSYRVEWDLGFGTFGNATVITGSLTADITAVDQGDEVSVRVSATNEAGTGPSSAIATAIAPSAPDPVGSVTADATVAARQVDLSWVAPDANGSAINGYDIQYKLDTQGWEDAITTASSPPLTTSASITGLNAGSDYEFRVRAVNGVDAGDYSTGVSATPADIPATPANFAVASFGDSEVALSWDAANANGSAITRYEYRLDDGNGFGTAISAGTSTTATVTGLTNGTAYDFQIRAVNAIGDSAWSTSITETPRTTPTTPANFAVASFSDSEVALSWDAANANGSAITRYEYRLDDGNGFGTAISAGTSTTATVTGLTNGTAYDFQIRAVNAIGDSAWSTSITETPRTTPTTPTAVVVTGGAGQISVAWTDPADNGGSPITQYDVRYRIGTGDWVEVIDYTENDPITGLNAATTFEVEARAVNGVGNSAWSTSASGTTDA